jgi:hypothetical protein
LPTSRLPLDVKTFLMDAIDSVSHLEVLLMLHQQPEKLFSAEAVCKELRSNVHSSSNQLAQLASRGLLKINDNKLYQYGPSSEELNQKVQKLFEIYKEMPVAVVTSIYEKPKDRLKDFSDAFKIKKD